jgi:lysophospholipase L1-like esterase
MVTVLCFGDSNTWGTVPGESRRYNEGERWPALLNHILQNVNVIEEGQQGRTIVYNNPFQGDQNGQRYLKDCLEKYATDLILILLGTNDLKKRYALNADTVAKNAASLAQEALRFKDSSANKKVKVLLIAPPPVYEVGFYAKMYQGAAVKSLELAERYAHYAQVVGCGFFDAGSVVTSCKDEGIHWQVEQHQLLANALAPVVIDMLADLG